MYWLVTQQFYDIVRELLFITALHFIILTGKKKTPIILGLPAIVLFFLEVNAMLSFYLYNGNLGIWEGNVYCLGTQQLPHCNVTACCKLKTDEQQQLNDVL